MAQVVPPSNALEFLKASLGYFDSSIPPALERYLSGLVFKARSDLVEMTVRVMDGNAADDQFVASYAEWLYRNKKGLDRPESLSREIRRRQVNNVTSGDS